MDSVKAKFQKRRSIVFIILTLVLANCLVALASKTTMGDFITVGSNFKGVSGAHYGHPGSSQGANLNLGESDKNDKYGDVLWSHDQLALNSAGGAYPGYSYGGSSSYAGSGAGSSGFGSFSSFFSSIPFSGIIPLVIIPPVVLGSSGSQEGSPSESNQIVEISFSLLSDSNEDESPLELDQTDLDNNVNAVPEPASLVLLSTGLVGIMGFRKRFKS